MQNECEQRGGERNAGLLGTRLYEEARRQDDLAQTKEDYACVEETYWRAFNTLADSSEQGHQEIRAGILERIARQLDGEGRKDAAEALRGRARSIREGAGQNT